jgi:hypothetical protein
VKIAFTSHGWEDYCSWAGDRKTLSRINRLMTEAARDPGAGTGKPERLSGDLAGFGHAASTRNAAWSTQSTPTNWSSSKPGTATNPTQRADLASTTPRQQQGRTPRTQRQMRMLCRR